MSQRSQLEKSVCWAVGSQVAKLGFAISTLASLVLINNHLNALIACVEGPPAPSSPLDMCNSSKVGDVAEASVHCCLRPRLTVELKLAGLGLFHHRGPAARAFLTWLRACQDGRDSCPIRYQNPVEDCYSRSYWRSKDFFCFDKRRELKYVVFSGQRFDKSDSLKLVRYIANFCPI
jgi:hypothetical protein